jgi:arginase family enzyme
MMTPEIGKKVVFFGCLLDSDERYDALQEKLASIDRGETFTDPYQSVLSLVTSELDLCRWESKGLIPIPDWLHPLPPDSSKPRLTSSEIIAFIDRNGCRMAAEEAGRFVKEEVFPNIPCLIAVDHCLTGEVYRRVAESHAPEETALVVLDSHIDAVPMSILAPAIQYDAENNPESVHDSEDPLLYDRPDSYNAGSFLYNLLIEGVVLPRNLYLLGISDYPPKQAFRLKDERIKNYVHFYRELKSAGVTLVTKEELLSSPSRVRRILEGIKTPYLYVSVDMDIGARNALEGVRFLDRQGLNEPQLFRLIGYLREILDSGVKLAGLDLTEFNPRKAGLDQTYPIAAQIIKKLLATVYFPAL